MRIGGKRWEENAEGVNRTWRGSVGRRRDGRGARLVVVSKYLFFLLTALVLAGRHPKSVSAWTLCRTPSADSAFAGDAPSTGFVCAPSASVLAEAGGPTTPVSGPTPPAPAPATPGPVRTWDFDHDLAGQNASGWVDVVGHWAVIADPTAPSLPNTFGLSSGRFFSSLMRLSNFYPLAVSTDVPVHQDFALEAWFKTVGGRLNCSGGLVFGYQGPQDYYVMEAGCPSDYFSVTRWRRDRYSVLGQTVVAIALGRWYKLKVTVIGPQITCFVDGRVVLRVNDNHLRPGKIGLSARADAQARFDDVTLAPLK